MEKLQWDSDFWGIDVYHLNNHKNMKVEEISSTNCLVQALPKVNDLEFIHYLECKGFSFKESKVSLQKEVHTKINIEKSNFRPLTLSELEQYDDVFFDLFGGNTRYNIFSEKKINEFYNTWVLNSIVGKMDDEAIGFFQNEKLAGIVTYRFHSTTITIGLMAVLPEFQGKSISQLLLSYVDNIAIKKNINRIRISTQGKNINALNAYIKNGYRILSIDHWYYYIKGVLK
ncbi:GNAT family N-acetyltransferase [Oceanobacillus sp. CF4.6]|uniref:GNAT family N-acetyltransferase n=1 Tax=Oceanobacillus sp. CF4.6 TaxID=3373080 RepID=UPI003EE6B597